VNEPISINLRFNALTDAWLPLIQADGTTLWGSPVEVLVGEKDGVDLEYPRDDFRVYGRLLLSALVQALFPACTSAELGQRIDTPLLRDEVMARIAPVLTEFDLFGPTPFLQVTPPANPPDKGAAPFVFPSDDLFQPQVRIDALSLPIALVMVFIEQTYAGGAGRGYGAGPAGQPGAFTLLDPGTVRRGAWANTLALDKVERLYANDDPNAWSNAKQAARPRASIGIVGGLFFQPRSIWLVPVGTGRCSFSGVEGPLVRRSPFLPKSELTKKASGKEDLWQHPCAPLAVNSQGIAAIRLNAERPAWTGLAQLLRPLSRAKGKTRVMHPNEGPAPVLQQWKSLAGRSKAPRLLVLDFDRDKANVKRRFFECYPLTEQFLSNDEMIERLRALVEQAQETSSALTKALTEAHDDRKRGGLARADADAAFWAATESPFWDWLATASSIEEWTLEDEQRADRAHDAMGGSLRKAAVALFDAQVTLSEFDPRKQERVARARRRLFGALYPKPPTANPTPKPARTTEVNP
jgi:CRISPR type I-E-associated protein CasA/Cse1